MAKPRYQMEPSAEDCAAHIADGGTVEVKVAAGPWTATRRTAEEFRAEGLPDHAAKHGVHYRLVL